MILRVLTILAAGGALSACASTPPEPEGPAERSAAALSELLIDTAQQEPARIEAAQPQMAALQAALTRPAVTPAADAAEAMSRIASEQDALPAAPDFSGARSVLSAVHLASYRSADTAAAGWRELQARHGADLSGLEPRLAEADLGERGVFLRLKAGPLDSPAAAAALCARLQPEQTWCAPVDFTGAPLSPAD